MDKDLCEFFFGVMKEHFTCFACSEKTKLVLKTLPEIRRKHKGDKLKRKSNACNFPSMKKKHKGDKSKRKGRELPPIRNATETSQRENVALFYEYSTCLASSTATSFSELVEKNSNFFRTKVQRKTVSICCIAGVLASEMVAVLKAVCHCMKDCMPEFLRFQLSFINPDDKWDSVTESVLKQLHTEVRDEYKVKFTHNLVKSQNRQGVLEVLQSSDVLVATKFSADVSDMKDKDFRKLLEVALQNMKSDSLFFLMDNTAAAVIKDLEKKISKFSQFQTVFKKAYDYHCLNLDSVEHHQKSHNEYFGVDLSSSYCVFSACAWLKSEKRKDSNREHTSVVTQNEVKKDKKMAGKSAYFFKKSAKMSASQAKK